MRTMAYDYDHSTDKQAALDREVAGHIVQVVKDLSSMSADALGAVTVLEEVQENLQRRGGSNATITKVLEPLKTLTSAEYKNQLKALAKIK